MIDSGDMFGETPPEDDTDDAPTAAELEAAGQNSMFGDPAPAAPPPTPAPITNQPYRVLARKYRPQTFSELIGQEPMVRTISNAFESGRVPQAWILTGAQEAVAKPKPGGKGYIIEWAVNFNPCLEVEPGKFYSVEMGDRPMGLNIALGDLDEKEKGNGNFGHFHHEDWFAGAKDVRTQLRQWGTLWIRTSPKPGRR